VLGMHYMVKVKYDFEFRGCISNWTWLKNNLCDGIGGGICWRLGRVEAHDKMNWDDVYYLISGFNIFIFDNIWDNPSHWLSNFSRWLKPPTSYAMFQFHDKQLSKTSLENPGFTTWFRSKTPLLGSTLDPSGAQKFWHSLMQGIRGSVLFLSVLTWKRYMLSKERERDIYIYTHVYIYIHTRVYIYTQVIQDLPALLRWFEASRWLKNHQFSNWFPFVVRNWWQLHPDHSYRHGWVNP
jgi:hypothetical protein